MYMYMYIQQCTKVIFVFSTSQNCRVHTLSANGSLLAWCDGERYMYVHVCVYMYVCAIHVICDINNVLTYM